MTQLASKNVRMEPALFHGYAVPLAHALQAADRTRPFGECLVEAATQVWRTGWVKDDTIGFGAPDAERAKVHFLSVLITDGEVVLHPSAGPATR